MAVCGIYKITNKETGECYVGQSIDIFNRFREHLSDKYEPTDWHTDLQNEIEKYSFEVLTCCDQKELDKKESYYIHKYDSVEHGYNKTYGNHSQFSPHNKTENITQPITILKETIEEPKEKKIQSYLPEIPLSEEEREQQFPYCMKDITKVVNATSQSIYKHMKKYSDFFSHNSIVIKRNRWYSKEAFQYLLQYYGKRK